MGNIERYIKERDVLKHWKYFLSLEKRFKETENFVYHGIETVEGNVQIINAGTYSNEFKQLLLLTAAEFECLAKELINVNDRNTRINEITKMILSKYPKIVETEIETDYLRSKPMLEWSYDEEEEKVCGLDWWNAYNCVKHEGEVGFSKATMENCLLALGSLYILNLYNIESTAGNLDMAVDTIYFKCQYTTGLVMGLRGSLPDFGNKTRRDAKEEMEEQLNIINRKLNK